MTIDDLIESLGNNKQSDFLVNLDRYLKQPGKTINDADCLGLTLLISAVRKDKVEVVSLLLQKKARVDQKCHNKRTALMYAARALAYREGSIPIMALLLKAGAQINEIDNVAFTALMHATYMGHLEAVIFLVENGADIEMRSSIGRTALMWATKEHFSQIVDYLLTQGVCIEKTDNQGLSALSIAVENHFKDILSSLLWRGAQFKKKLKVDSLVRTTLFNILTKIGRSVPLWARPNHESLEGIQKYNDEVIRRAEESGKEVGKNALLSNDCLNLVTNYLYTDWECLGIFYQAFSMQRGPGSLIKMQEDMDSLRLSSELRRVSKLF